MKLSIRSEYALRALIELGVGYGDGVVRIQTISERQRIPKRFLEQILNDLRAAGFVESRRGVAGGYRLAHSPETISLAALMGYIQGELPLSQLPIGAGQDSHDAAAFVIQSIVREARDAMQAVLARITLEDLCERARGYRQEMLRGGDYVI